MRNFYNSKLELENKKDHIKILLGYMTALKEIFAEAEKQLRKEIKEEKSDK